MTSVQVIHKLYNPLLAIDILREVKLAFPSASLCMIGPDKDGSLALTKNRVIELGLEDAVTFTGILSKEEWPIRSVDYDIFINTTNFDNMPISVIEAMALGLAIVSTNVGGLPYLIEDEKDGLLVNAGSSKDFSESIQKFCRLGLRKIIGK
ncbi:MAG: glycosyltransferase family 4 protein [Cytophagales bacterium]|nr:glycosyltransferase family 4 protein [Cytophagales bacterium]